MTTTIGRRWKPPRQIASFQTVQQAYQSRPLNTQGRRQLRLGQPGIGANDHQDENSAGLMSIEDSRRMKSETLESCVRRMK